MNKPLVSVVLPCYNVQDYVADAIRSVIQAYNGPLQIIAVDNNSTDGTRQVLESLRDDIKELIVTEELTKGACAARNKGLNLSDGVYVQFLDADDLLMADKLNDQVELLEKAHADAICAAYTRQSVDGKRSEVDILSDVWKGLFVTRLGITSSCLFRTSKVREINGWNESLRSSQEYDLMFRMLCVGAVFLTSEKCQTIIRERNSGQISTGDPAPRWKQYLDLRVAILRHLDEHAHAYLIQEYRFFHQAFYDILHITYPHQPKYAAELYYEWLLGRYVPTPSAAVTPLFVRLHKLFGFPMAERIKSWLK